MRFKKNYIQELHLSTSREPIKRMMDDKINCMKIARNYDYDFWDGDRRYGYGGYKYIDGYWTSVAEKLIEDYNLNKNSKILDVGCGKGYLLFEIHKLIPDIKIAGFDISNYAVENAKDEIKSFLYTHKAEEKTKYLDCEFDLVFTLATLHNLHLRDLVNSIKEISRISKQSYIMVESYRNLKELFNLQCWALTCNAFYNDDDWQYIFEFAGYEGDYEFIYFS
tara:strand:- start:779 stop:1444 length:666 start_codon:yes stop_codon:yes gene_type:complete